MKKPATKKVVVVAPVQEMLFGMPADEPVIIPVAPRPLQPVEYDTQLIGSFLLKTGKEFFRRLQPVPWQYIKPNIKGLKRKL